MTARPPRLSAVSTPGAAETAPRSHHCDGAKPGTGPTPVGLVPGQTSPRSPRRRTPKLICEVALPGQGGTICTGARAVPFTAVCGCGHPIAHLACPVCLTSTMLACFTCWGKPGPDRHKCPVTFTGREADSA